MPSINRREWLAGTTLTLLANPMCAEAPRRTPLGFSLYGMKSLSLADALRACAKIGYDGVELALMPGYPAEPKILNVSARKELRDRLRDQKLALHGLMENLAEPATDAVHRTNLDRLKAAAELGHALAPGTPPVIETILGGKPADWDATKMKVVDRLRDWAKVAKDARAVIAIKPHVGNALHSIEGATWLMKELDTPHIRLGFDFSHLTLHGVTLAKAVTALVPHAAFVHLKDARGTPAKYEFLLPGTAGIDYREYARLLVDASYSGPAVVEVSGMISNKPGYDAVAAATRSYANLAKAFGRTNG